MLPDTVSTGCSAILMPKGVLFLTLLASAYAQVFFNETSDQVVRGLSAALPTLEPRPTIPEVCNDPVTKKAGYEPYCPPGYFRCCATCPGAKCYSTKGLVNSWRGVPECILCKPGDFCSGCDTYRRCKLSSISGREGYRISAPGSTRPQDCQICAGGYEADLPREKCMRKWKDQCSENYVGRCVRNCRSMDPLRGKDLTHCERWKCYVYCAKRWSEDCLGAYQRECQYLKDGPGPYDTRAGTDWLDTCDVDCSGTPRSAGFWLVLLALAGLLTFL